MHSDTQPDDTVAIWGADPVGQMAIRIAILLGAEQVVVIERMRKRPAMGRDGGAIIINFEEQSA